MPRPKSVTRTRDKPDVNFIIDSSFVRRSSRLSNNQPSEPSKSRKDKESIVANTTTKQSKIDPDDNDTAFEKPITLENVVLLVDESQTENLLKKSTNILNIDHENIDNIESNNDITLLDTKKLDKTDGLNSANIDRSTARVDSISQNLTSELTEFAQSLLNSTNSNKVPTAQPNSAKALLSSPCLSSVQVSDDNGEYLSEGSSLSASPIKQNRHEATKVNDDPFSLDFLHAHMNKVVNTNIDDASVDAYGRVNPGVRRHRVQRESKQQSKSNEAATSKKLDDTTRVGEEDAQQDFVKVESARKRRREPAYNEMDLYTMLSPVDLTSSDENQIDKSHTKNGKKNTDLKNNLTGGESKHGGATSDGELIDEDQITEQHESKGHGSSEKGNLRRSSRISKAQLNQKKTPTSPDSKHNKKPPSRSGSTKPTPKTRRNSGRLNNSNDKTLVDNFSNSDSSLISSSKSELEKPIYKKRRKNQNHTKVSDQHHTNKDHHTKSIFKKSQDKKNTKSISKKTANLTDEQKKQQEEHDRIREEKIRELKAQFNEIDKWELNVEVVDYNSADT